MNLHPQTDRSTVNPPQKGSTMSTTAPADWHAYIRSAPTFADSQDRMQEAVAAGVDFAALTATQGRRNDVR